VIANITSLLPNRNPITEKLSFKGKILRKNYAKRRREHGKREYKV